MFASDTQESNNGLLVLEIVTEWSRMDFGLAENLVHSDNPGQSWVQADRTDRPSQS